MIAAGFVEAAPPWELVMSWLCQFYTCLPSQLDEEPADNALLYWQVDQVYQEYYRKAHPTPKMGGRRR